MRLPTDRRESSPDQASCGEPEEFTVEISTSGDPDKGRFFQPPHASEPDGPDRSFHARRAVLARIACVPYEL